MTSPSPYSSDEALKDLLVTTKDGDWGKSEPTPGHVPYRVIRGTDFPRVRLGDVSSVPLRYLQEKTVSRRTLQPNDILIETAGGSQDRPTGRTLLITERILQKLDAPATCASFARFLRIDTELAVPGYVYWFLQNLYLSGEMDQHQVRHTGVARFQYTWFAQTQRVPLPPRPVQVSIATTLGALDEKIESDRRARVLMRQLGAAELEAAIVDDSHEVRLGDVTVSIARGVAPKYADHDPNAAIVLNQRCVRDGWIDTGFARRMVPKKVVAERRAARGDVLVNSTGAGTLGRLGRWHVGDAFVDGHVTVVKADADVVGPVVLAYAMFGCESEIEGMATGSTGQTELSPARLAELELQLPSDKLTSSVEENLLALEERIASLAHEESVLSQLRDTLLPELLSGHIRVPESHGVIEEAMA